MVGVNAKESDPGDLAVYRYKVTGEGETNKACWDIYEISTPSELFGTRHAVPLRSSNVPYYELRDNEDRRPDKQDFELARDLSKARALQDAQLQIDRRYAPIHIGDEMVARIKQASAYADEFVKFAAQAGYDAVWAWAFAAVMDRRVE